METQTQDLNAPAAPTQPPAAPEPLSGKRANWTVAHKVEGQKITWSVKGIAEVLVLDVTKVHAANRARAEVHGMVQRVNDAAAMSRDAKTGASATPQQKYEAMKKLVEHYASGAEGWSPVREAGAGRSGASGPSAQVVLLVSALKIHAPQKSEETIAGFVAKLAQGQVVALLNSAELKEAVELAREQEREREALAAQGVNAAELLAGLG